MSVPAIWRPLFSPQPRLAYIKLTTASGFAIAARRWMTNTPGNTSTPDHTSAPNNTSTPDYTSTPVKTTAAPPIASGLGPMGDIARVLSSSSRSRFTSTSPMSSREAVLAPVSVDSELDPSGLDLQSLTAMPPQEDDYHLHIYSSKHNTHITFTRPNKEPIVSLSGGSVGFKKGHRGTYDAAYQLAASVFKAIEDKNIQPRGVEVVLRGFGQGREAVVKALLGQEGRFLRPVIGRITDSTRLKFGGTRSKKPRRLG